MTAPSRECPAPGCKTPISSETFACRPHWYALPKPMRDKIWRTYRRWRRGDIDLEELELVQQEAVNLLGQDRLAT